MNTPGFVSAWTGRSLTPRVAPQISGQSAPSRPRYAKNVRMAVSVKSEPLPQSQVRLEITADEKECSAAWESVMKELGKRATVDGFRKGKAPRQLIINQYGKETIRASACEEVIEKSIQKALADAGVRAIGQAILDNGEEDINGVIASFSPKSPLTFKVKIDVWPEADISGTIENMELTAVKVPFDEAIVDSALDDLRQKNAFSVLSPDGTKADIGKIVVANMVGYYRNEDGSKGDALPDVASGDMIEIRMKEGQYMPGFVEGIVGMDVNETRSVNVQFPNNSGRPELAGAKAIFDVTVHAVKDEKLPELNNDFAKKASESPTLKDLKDAIRARLSTESEVATSQNVNRAIEDKLVEMTEVSLPETMIEERVKNKFAKMLSDFKDKGMPDEQVKSMVTKENYELYKGRARANVERSLVANFAITSLAKQYKFVAQEDEVVGQMEYIKAELRGEAMDEDKIKDQVEAELERDMVLKYIKESAKITYTDPAPETPETAPASA